ncbi:MAG TPA: hypothetical protein VGR35_23240 [Tepidisphaeraceae bacterium]|nr:hypothetical protein [Tepidisphaeraceae bacterium]
MFCGWRLANSFAELARLGSGELEIDCLTGACRFRDGTIASLAIAQELKAWLHADFAKHAIDPAWLDQAWLRAKLEVTQIDRRARTTPTVYLGRDGKPMKPSTLVRCAIACESGVKTETTLYSASKSDIEEFPAEWPAA